MVCINCPCASPPVSLKTQQYFGRREGGGTGGGCAEGGAGCVLEEGEGDETVLISRKTNAMARNDRA